MSKSLYNYVAIPKKLYLIIIIYISYLLLHNFLTMGSDDLIITIMFKLNTFQNTKNLKLK